MILKAMLALNIVYKRDVPVVLKAEKRNKLPTQRRAMDMATYRSD